MPSSIPLSIGDKLGPYEILAPLGAGGMGEVWKARDTRLDRTVAIKTSKTEFGERFEREARAVAALNHPNICQLYDVGPDYLVMEYVEGTALKGPLPLEQALRYAGQICDALDAAHRKGITHRDLKPGNVLVAKPGIKLLDFGLAKMESKPMDDATVTMALTGKNEIIGTLYYMSPEQLQAQATGTEVDGRSDIFSFGLVLYEMLTGKRAFDGASPASVIAGIMERPAPSIGDIAPAGLDRVLKKCLEKDPEERWQSARDLKTALEWAGSAPIGESAASAPAAKRTEWGWIAAGVLFPLVLAAGWMAYRETRPVEAKPLQQFSVDLGPEAVRAPRQSLELTPDGTRLIYTARKPNGTFQLFSRQLDQPAGVAIGSAESIDPELFLSPDGKWAGYWNGVINKVPTSGGASYKVGDTPGSTRPIGASWGDDDNIVIGTAAGLMRIPSSGGRFEPVHPGDARVEILPDVLPGSKGILFTQTPQTMTDVFTGDLKQLPLNIAVIELATGKIKTLVQGGYAPRYFPTGAGKGHLVYAHDGALYAVPFDPQRLEIQGAPAPVLTDLLRATSPADVGRQFTGSNTGLFAYLASRGDGSSAFQIALESRDGKITPLVDKPGSYGAPRFSPDGKKLAYIASGGKGPDVWAYDLERRVATQLTFQGTSSTELVWTSDSRHLIYGDETTLWWIRSDGSAQPQMLAGGLAGPRPDSLRPGTSPKEVLLAFSEVATGLPQVWTLPLDLTDPDHPHAGKPQGVLTQAPVQVDPAFSPDGKFLAYASNESGSQEELYVRSFPGLGGKWKVSTGGGKFPAWSAATHEILFLAQDDQVMAASYTVNGDSISFGTPHAWSAVKIRRNGVQQNFDISPDGRRLAMFPAPVAESAAGSLHATFVVNFFDELRRRAAFK